MCIFSSGPTFVCLERTWRGYRTDEDETKIDCRYHHWKHVKWRHSLAADWSTWILNSLLLMRKLEKSCNYGKKYCHFSKVKVTVLIYRKSFLGWNSSWHSWILIICHTHIIHDPRICHDLVPRFRSCRNILSKLDFASVNFHNRKCLAMKLIQYTYKFK